MGFFGSKEKKHCINCGKIVGMLSSNTADGVLCKDCFKRCGYDNYKFSEMATTSSKTLIDIRNDITKVNLKNEMLQNFNPTKKVGIYFEVDEEKRQWLVPDYSLAEKGPIIYSFMMLSSMNFFKMVVL